MSACAETMPEEVAPPFELQPDVIRIAQYSVYPRVSRAQHQCLGYARETDSSGLCLSVRTPESVGELLRIGVRDLSGRLAAETLARVVSCDPMQDGSFEIRLDLIAAHRTRALKRRAEALSA